MKPRAQLSRSNGSAMILALLLIGVAGVLTAGWIALVLARSQNVETMGAAVQRRIALENSKALAQEFMLERVMASTSGNAFNYDLPDPTWGGIQVSAWATAPLLSTTQPAGVNHFDPGNGQGYTLDVPVTVRDGDAGHLRKYQVRSRSPLLAGVILSMQTPTLTPAASLAVGAMNVGGAAFIWRPNLSMTFTANSYSMPTPGNSAAPSFTNSAGSTLEMNNLALPRQIANPRSGGAACFTGELDVVNNSNSAANSSMTKVLADCFTLDAIQTYPNAITQPEGIVSDGNGNVTITVGTQGLNGVYIPGKILSLTLSGQAGINDAAADDRPAMLIVVDQPSILSGDPSNPANHDLTQIVLAGHNSRRIDLAIKKRGGITGGCGISFATTSAAWRLLLEVENCPVTFTAAGTATIQGGIRSDRSLSLSSGGIRVTAEGDPKNLERLASRNAWVESFVESQSP